MPSRPEPALRRREPGPAFSTASQAAAPAPSLPLMHAAFILAGLGTLLLGPILPLLSQRWQLNDSRSGLLLLAQFVGATLGGSTVTPRLRRDLVLGLAAACVGFALFAFAPSLWPACATLVLGGFGVGRVISAVNITAGERFRHDRASALSWLNFSWSLGALLSPLAAARLTQRYSLPLLLLCFAGCWLLVLLAFVLQLRMKAEPQQRVAPQVTSDSSLEPRLLLLFATLLLLYGGMETSLGGWLATYAQRYLQQAGLNSLVTGQYITVLLLAGLTGGRALAAVLLKFIADQTLQRAGLLLSAFAIAALALSHSRASIAGLAVLLGITIAPVFPATFAIVMSARPSERQAGMILAASGIGASTLPALIGVVSTHTGSLRIALGIPVAAAAALLALTFLQPSGAAISAESEQV